VEKQGNTVEKWPLNFAYEAKLLHAVTVGFTSPPKEDFYHP
jgi:hypothetical protein